MSPSEFKQIMCFIGQNVALCFSAALCYHEKTVENRGFPGQNEGATVENEYYIDPTDPIFDIGETLNRLARKGAQLYAATK